MWQVTVNYSSNTVLCTPELMTSVGATAFWPSLSHLTLPPSLCKPPPYIVTNSLFQQSYNVLVSHCWDKIFDIDNVERVVWVHGFRPELLVPVVLGFGAKLNIMTGKACWKRWGGKKRREGATFPALPKSMYGLCFLSPPTMPYLLILLPHPDNVLTWDHT